VCLSVPLPVSGDSSFDILQGCGGVKDLKLIFFLKKDLKNGEFPNLEPRDAERERERKREREREREVY